jgi:hypothetical protein
LEQDVLVLFGEVLVHLDEFEEGLVDVALHNKGSDFEAELDAGFRFEQIGWDWVSIMGCTLDSRLF